MRCCSPLLLLLLMLLLMLLPALNRAVHQGHTQRMQSTRHPLSCAAAHFYYCCC
jgi:hypothetical protein